jgi:hypothetical protein
MTGNFMTKITLYYRLAEPGILYVYNSANHYNGIWIDNLFCDDTAPNYDWTITKIETCSAITTETDPAISAYTVLPTVRFYSMGSTGYTSNSFLPSANNSLSLGSSDYKWSSVYATNLYGTFKGNADTASALSSAGTTGQFWRGDNTWSNTLTGDLKLYTNAEGASPAIIFNRDYSSNTDWKIQVTAGKLQFFSATDAATWSERAYFKDNSGDFVATSFTGNGSALTNLNASNLSSGTVAAARLPSVSRTNNTSTASPAHGATFTAIDSVTTDTYGRVTAVNTKTVTLPSDSNTDTLVKQTAKTDAAEYKILATQTASPTSGAAAEANYSASVTLNPSTAAITATTYKVTSNATITYNSSNGCLEIIV